MNLGTVMSPRSRRLQNSTQTKYIPARPSEPRSHDSPTHRADAVPRFSPFSLHFITFFYIIKPLPKYSTRSTGHVYSAFTGSPKREHLSRCYMFRRPYPSPNRLCCVRVQYLFYVLFRICTLLHVPHSIFFSFYIQIIAQKAGIKTNIVEIPFTYTSYKKIML